MSEQQKEYLAKIKKYFEETGTDVIMVTAGMRITMKPGSAYEDIKKEKLPDEFQLKSDNLTIPFPKSIKEQYKITHKVDFDRLLRGVSIVLTGFLGPIEEDTLKNHHKRLFMRYLAWDPIDAEDDLATGLEFFGDFIGVSHKEINEFDYLNVAQILNDYYTICVNPM